VLEGANEGIPDGRFVGDALVVDGLTIGILLGLLEGG